MICLLPRFCPSNYTPYVRTTKRFKAILYFHTTLSHLKIADWVKILQYAKSYTPTPNLVGNLSKSGTSSDFAKLSDAAINAIRADNDGYFYFKLVDAGDQDQPTMLVRTKAKFSDTARAFGWSNNFDVCKPTECKTTDVSACAWKKGDTVHGGGYFDTEQVYSNDCGRWFTDYSSAVECYNVSSSERCFNKGAPCGHAVRDHVTMYKWSPQGTPKPTPKPTPKTPITSTFGRVFLPIWHIRTNTHIYAHTHAHEHACLHENNIDADRGTINSQTGFAPTQAHARATAVVTWHAGA